MFTNCLMKRIISLFLLLCLASLASAQEKPKIDPEQRYLLLATTRTKTMQKELDEAAAKGFRIILASSNKTEMVYFMERVATPPDTYQYLLLATLAEKTMEKELNEAAQKGFRLLPQTMVFKEGWTIFQTETVVLMEKQPENGKRYEYRVIIKGGTGASQKAVSEAADKGFRLMAMTYANGLSVIMEKENTAAP